MTRRQNLIAGLIGFLTPLIGAAGRAAAANPQARSPWTPPATLAVDQPPSSLAAFDLSVEPPAVPKASNSVDFAVACKACGGRALSVFAYPLAVPDPSPYVGLDPGEVFNRPPHRLSCAGCGGAHTIFDVRTDGYDGVLNGGGSYESGESGEAQVAGPSRIKVTVEYNIGLDELHELAASAARHPSDLFDWFGLQAAPLDGSPALELEYECA